MRRNVVCILISSLFVAAAAAAKEPDPSFREGVYEGRAVNVYYDEAGKELRRYATDSCELWLNKEALVETDGGLAFVLQACVHGDTEFLHLPTFYFGDSGTVEALDTFGVMNIVESSDEGDRFSYRLVHKQHSYTSSISIDADGRLKISGIHVWGPNTTVRKNTFELEVKFSRPFKL